MSGATYASGAVIAFSLTVLTTTAAAVVDELGGSYTVSIGAILDGQCVSVGAVGIPGAVPANAVIVQSTSSLPTGVQAIGKVIAIGMVGIELWNISGSTYTPGTTTFNVTVLQ